MSDTIYDYSDEIVSDIIGFLEDLPGTDELAVLSDGSLDDVVGIDEDGFEFKMPFPAVLVNIDSVQEEYNNIDQTHIDQTYNIVVTVIAEVTDGERRFAVQRQWMQKVYKRLMDMRDGAHWTVNNFDFAQVTIREYQNDIDRFLFTRGVPLVACKINMDVVVHAQALPETLYTLTAVLDTYIDSTAPDTDFSSSTLLKVGYNKTPVEAQYGLLLFDLSSLPQFDTLGKRVGSVKTATLKLFTSAAFSEIGLRMGALSNMIPSPVTWNTYSPNVSNYVGYTRTSAQGDGEIKEFDITSLVRLWQESGEPNYGIIIEADASDVLDFNIAAFHAGDQYAAVLEVTTLW